jgi:BirA family biotin operon repressor/biotin-[acetyl-CoA-carboxylase] ligase
MVNEKPFLLHAAKYSTKSALLAELRETQFVSGAALADKLGISRVAVWKAVKALIENGYQIEIRGNGYFLDPENEKDLVYPWEFGTKEAFFRCYKSTGSTMDRMRELAEKGAPGGMAITAEKQSSGRGRNGRTWISKQGGLYFTLLERPALAVADYMQSSLIFQMAAAQAISSVGAKAYPRWPNDIYVKGKKIAGVMTEISAEGDILKWLSIGVGVNVNNSPPSAKTTSCAEISGHHVSRRDLLIKILDEAEKLHSRHK